MSLDLDERQRAMLKEMGVTVWWPKPVLLQPEAAVAAPQAKPLDAEKTSEYSNFNNNNGIKTSKNDIKNIAVSAINTVTISLNQSDTVVSNNYSEGESPLQHLTWPLLVQAAASCRACALCEGRTQTVFGCGPAVTSHTDAAGLANADSANPSATPPQVDWLIVGDVPGDAEDQAGQPFAGEEGQLLDNMLKAMGLARGPAPQSRVYLSTVVKCRPPGLRNPLPDEVAQCSAYLHRQIALLQPKIILTLGKLAAQTLLRDSLPEVGKLPPGKLRGQVHRYQPEGANIPLVATYAPTYLLRKPLDKARVWEDLVLAMETLKTIRI